MANWARTLDLSDIWDKDTGEGEPLATLAQQIADRLRLLPPYPSGLFNEEVEKLAELFEEVAQDGEEAEHEQFNWTMGELYDFGDSHCNRHEKTLWVRTT